MNNSTPVIAKLSVEDTSETLPLDFGISELRQACRVILADFGKLTIAFPNIVEPSEIGGPVAPRLAITAALNEDQVLLMASTYRKVDLLTLASNTSTISGDMEQEATFGNAGAFEAVIRDLEELDYLTPENSSFNQLLNQVSSGVTVSGRTNVTIQKIRSDLQQVFCEARGEEFEYGIESKFSRALNRLVEDYGNNAVSGIDNILRMGQLSEDVASEALRQLGSIEHPPTHEKRLYVLQGFLQSEKAWVRDSASLGIASMDDPSAIQSLKEAILLEGSPELKRDLQQVLDQLVLTEGCLST